MKRRQSVAGHAAPWCCPADGSGWGRAQHRLVHHRTGLAGLAMFVPRAHLLLLPVHCRPLQPLTPPTCRLLHPLPRTLQAPLLTLLLQALAHSLPALSLPYPPRSPLPRPCCCRRLLPLPQLPLGCIPAQNGIPACMEGIKVGFFRVSKLTSAPCSTQAAGWARGRCAAEWAQAGPQPYAAGRAVVPLGQCAAARAQLRSRGVAWQGNGPASLPAFRARRWRTRCCGCSPRCARPAGRLSAGCTAHLRTAAASGRTCACGTAGRVGA